jgi:hypothetical protein
MNIDDIYQGDSLRAADLKGQAHVVVIETVTRKDFDDGPKLVLTFQGRKKSLITNKTNANRIAFAHGKDTDRWVGREIELYPDLVDFQGKTVEAIRIRPVARPASVPHPRQVSVAAGQVIQERDDYTVSTGTAPHPNAPGVNLEDTF